MYGENKMALKTVLFPIKVPDGKYCWEWTGEHWICPHFNLNEGGYSHCPFFSLFHIKKEDLNGYPKPAECLELKDA
jgi:hypothetical protein